MTTKENISKKALEEDRKAVLAAKKGDKEAEEFLIRKYAGMVRMKCCSYYVKGADKEDLIQEGMIGLIEAIREYEPEKNTEFHFFAGICIARQILTAIKAGNRLKHIPLNMSVSLEQCPECSDPILEILPDESAVNPEDQFILQEDRRRLHESVDSILTRQEQSVFTAYMDGYSYQKIASAMCLTVKAVDNSLQRVKRKVKLSETWRL